MPEIKEKSAVEELKTKFADAGGFGPGADDGDEPDLKADPDLDDEIEPEPEPGAEVDPGETPEGEAALDGEEKTGGASAKATAAEDAALLGSEKFTKQGKGEFISKESFLKRLKKESAKAKESEAKLAPFLAKAAEYQHWDQYSKGYREAAAYVNRLRPVFQTDPWLASLIEDRLSGKPTDWNKVTNSLKPFLAPFWEGVAEPIQTDPAVMALQRAEAVEKQLKEFQQQQTQERQTYQQQQQSQVVRQQNQAVFAQTEKAVWTKWKKYNNSTYRDILFDRAERIQAQLPEGTLVDLSKVAAEVFGAFEKEATERALAGQKARERTRRAAGEGSGGLPGSPLPVAPKAETPKDLRGQVKADILKRFGKTFTE